MNAEALQAIEALGASNATAPSAVQAGGVAGADFTRLVSEGLSAVNQQLQVAETGLQQLASGQVENLHQVMIQLEEAKLSFQLLMQVRGRLLEAYQDVMRMQI